MIPAIQYTTWLSLFALSLELFVQLPENEGIIIKSRWSDLSAIELQSNTKQKIILIDFYKRASREKIRSFALVPWQSLYPISRDELKMDTKSLLTVNPICLVYDIQAMAEPVLNPTINAGMEVLFDVLYNEKILATEENYTLKPGIQVIRMQEHPFYVQFEVATPGSVNMDLSRLERKYPMKMIKWISIPDRGSIIATWLKTGEPYLNDAFMQEQEKMLRIIKRTLRKCKRHPDQKERESLHVEALAKIRRIVENHSGNRDESLFHFSSNLLKKLLWIEHEALQNIPPANPFPDYQPKKSPDNLLDFRPSLGEQFDALPFPHLENLTELIELLLKYQEEADNKPGSFTDGNPLLGAPDKEYIPSDAELLCSECGERILIILQKEAPEAVKNLLEVKNIRIKEIVFQRFIITHADVMGSGRFFYVDHMDEIRISLPD